MVTARADKLLLALLELHGVIPHAVAEAAVDWYDTPQPVNYETAEEFVHERIHDLIDSGALDDVMGDDGPSSAPVGSSPGRAGGSVPYRFSSPPAWLLSAYIDCYSHWDDVIMPEPEEC